MNYEIKIIDKKQISSIKELWKKLNKIHLNDSDYFKDFYSLFKLNI